MQVDSKYLSDEFWQEVTRLLPAQSERRMDRAFARKVGAGRKRKPDRLVFGAILFVLRTGCKWKALPFERFGSASTVHKRFLEWERAGVFEAIFRAGLAEREEMAGIAWSWRGAREATMNLPHLSNGDCGEPKEQETKRQHRPVDERRTWRPVVSRRIRGGQA